jgi:undecaprenyl-diphosphatase
MVAPHLVGAATPRPYDSAVVSWLEAIVLGIAQGLTEFLPISSTAHLRIVPAFAGWEDPGAFFTAVVQLGTMLAVVIYFWRDLVRIVLTWLFSLRRPELRGELDARMGWYVIVATIPIAIFGLAFNDQIEEGARNLYLIGVMLIVLGLVLLAADWTSKRLRDVKDVGMRDAVWVGVAQALALIPGTSRSGATITAGLFLGLKREAAARFSFLLSVPAIVLSGLYGLVEIFTGDGDISLGALAISTLFAFIFGYLSIAFLLRFLATHSTLVFVVYRVVLGGVVIGLTAAGTIS